MVGAQLGDVNVTVSATRSVHIESRIVSGSGKVNNVVFTQNLSYKNVQTYADQAAIQVRFDFPCSKTLLITHCVNPNVQNVAQTATGTVTSTHNGVTSLTDKYSFPLNINLTLLNPSGSECEL